MERSVGGLAVLHGAGPCDSEEEEAAEPDPARLGHRLNLERPLALLDQPSVPASDHESSQADQLLRRVPEGGRARPQEGARVQLQEAGRPLVGHVEQVAQQPPDAHRRLRRPQRPRSRGQPQSEAGHGVRQGRGRQRPQLGQVGQGARAAAQPEPSHGGPGGVTRASRGLPNAAANSQQKYGLFSVS